MLSRAQIRVCDRSHMTLIAPLEVKSVVRDLFDADQTLRVALAGQLNFTVPRLRELATLILTTRNQVALATVEVHEFPTPPVR